MAAAARAEQIRQRLDDASQVSEVLPRPVTLPDVYLRSIATSVSRVEILLGSILEELREARRRK